MDEIIIKEREYTKRTSRNHVGCEVKVEGNTFVGYKDNDKYNLSYLDGEKSKMLSFFKFGTPYLDMKLMIDSEAYSGYHFSLYIKLKNIPHVLSYLNHDIILREHLLSKWHYSNSGHHYRYVEFSKYNEILSPIYKSKLNIKPSNNVDLFDYQLNNIEIMNKIIDKPFQIPISDKCINLQKLDQDDPERQVFFDNFENTFTFENKFLDIRSKGCIIADEMGLGKTITTISFLKSLKSIKPSMKDLQAKGHLIIVPSHLAKQWEGEIKKVWEDAQVKLILTKRDHLALTTKDVLDYDFIIVTQQFLINKNHYLCYPDYHCTPSTFGVEQKISKFKNVDGTIKYKDLEKIPPVFELIKWNNVVLDEGHEIMNNSFGNSQSVSVALYSLIKEMKGNNYWYISGTPYTTGAGIRNILNFLKVEFNVYNNWESWEKTKYMNIVYSKNFLQNILLRHTKKQVEEQIELKGIEEKIYWLTQTPTEKQIYTGSRHRGRSYLLRLCCHLMVADFNSAIKIQTVDIEDVKNNIIAQSQAKIDRYTKLIEKLDTNNPSFHMLKSNYTQIVSQAKFMLEAIKKLDKSEDTDDPEEDDECPICIDEVNDPTILPCGHIFCYDCINEMTQVKKQCPLCKQEIKDKLIKVADKKDKKDNEKKDDLIETYGVKTGTLIRLVRKITSNPENNIIIFSQYDFMLKLISDSLSQNGVSNSFVKGNVFQRNKAIDTFKGVRMGEESSKVIMLSLRNAASGTHLVEANHIIFVDPVDSYRAEVLDIENQAIARAFRIGQKKKVNIHRLLVKDTLEEEIYNKIYLGKETTSNNQTIESSAGLAVFNNQMIDTDTDSDDSDSDDTDSDDSISVSDSDEDSESEEELSVEEISVDTFVDIGCVKLKAENTEVLIDNFNEYEFYKSSNNRYFLKNKTTREILEITQFLNSEGENLIG